MPGIHPELRTRYEQSLRFFKQYPPTIVETFEGIEVQQNHPDAVARLQKLSARIQRQIDTLNAGDAS